MTERASLIRRTTALLLAACTTVSLLSAQAPAPPTQPPPAQTATTPPAQSEKNAKLPTTSARRRAAKLYMQAAELYQKQQYDKAVDLYQQALKLDPTNPNYRMAADVARSHEVTALIQEATQNRFRGNEAAARAALARALELDPENPMVSAHVQGLADEAVPTGSAVEAPKIPELAGPLEIEPKPGTRSFHLHSGTRQILQQVFNAWGLNATIDMSVRSERVRFDIDDATFAQATRAAGMLSNSFYVPIDVHRVLVARNSNANKLQYERNAVDTISLSGMETDEMTEMGNIARNVFELRQINVDPSAATLTLRGPVQTLDAFNATYRDLLEGRSQVLLEVRMIQLAHTNSRNTGVQPTQTISAFNVYAEEQAILNQNQALVQEIISSGLAAPGDTLAILGILLASGQVSSSLFQNGLAIFGGGITQSALIPGNAPTINLSLNSSDSRALDDFRIRLQDGDEGTLKSGTRYPIMTSSYGGAGGRGLNIPGLNLPGTSGALGSLLSSLQGASQVIPQFQYQDLGLVLKTRPRVLRSGDVAMTVDMKITALAGRSLNNVPVLASRSYTGAVTVPINQGVVLAAEMDKSEMRAISGYPGLSEIPGFNDITDKDVEKNTATLLIIITPHVIRSPHLAGHTPMLMVDKNPRDR
jgi:general secretion pathway protein D